MAQQSRLAAARESELAVASRPYTRAGSWLGSRATALVRIIEGFVLCVDELIVQEVENDAVQFEFIFGVIRS